MEFAVRVADTAKGETDAGLSTRRHIPPGMCGYDQVPFGILTTRGLIAVADTPSLKRFGGWASLDPANCDKAGALLTRARWRLGDMRLRDGVYRGFVGQEDKAVRLYLLNTRLAELMLMSPGEPTAGWLEGYPPPQLEGEAAAETLARRMRPAHLAVL